MLILLLYLILIHLALATLLCDVELPAAAQVIKHHDLVVWFIQIIHISVGHGLVLQSYPSIICCFVGRLWLWMTIFASFYNGNIISLQSFCFSLLTSSRLRLREIATDTNRCCSAPIVSRCVSCCGELVSSWVPTWHGRCGFVPSTIGIGYIARVETMRVDQSQSCWAILAALILDVIGVVTLLSKYQIVMCWELRRNRWQSPSTNFRGLLLKSHRCLCCHCLWRRRLITEDRFTCYLDHLSLWC